jgi:hypothetical protein
MVSAMISELVLTVGDRPFLVSMMPCTIHG